METVDVDVDVDDKTEWSTRNDVIFIRIMHEHVRNGDLQTSTFNKRVWSTIGDELFQQTKKRFTVFQLKSKFNRLRKKHREFSDLIAHTEFGWDPISNTVTAPEAVWVEYIKMRIVKWRIILLRRQHLVHIACCVLHNFIRSQDRGDRMFTEYENEDMLIEREGEAECRPIPNIDLSPSNVALMSNIFGSGSAYPKKIWIGFVLDFSKKKKTLNRIIHMHVKI
ncbi:hypothetical protein Ddye_029543 [Dipteronia dyeriana]|uniref:Myb/SANT-like domain-containing protein n=1 Tax=Dipteronia dyeriana TaxID=168575 RepID=A0AAD9TEZ7_9ROSI|nr:hypothetical protein Ddye_029543 [Dipteronia dyeriana]